MTATIEAHGLEKRYGKTRGLDGLNLIAEPGQVLAVLGPNGAGKTTFVRAIATLLRLDAGTLRVFGHDVRNEPVAVRRLLGLAGQFAAVEPAMTGRENLEMVARLYGQKRATARASAQRVLEQLSLVEPADRLVRTYSGGMRRRLDLGASLVGRPRLLLLDEPTTGLDPRSRIELWDAIRGLVETGTDVLLTTQYLDEADQLASRLVIIDHGRTIAEGTPAELKAEIGGARLEVTLSEANPAASGALEPFVAGPVHLSQDGRRLRAPVRSGGGLASTVVRALDAAGITVDDVEVHQPSLDDVFFALTGRPAEIAEASDEPDLEVARS